MSSENKKSLGPLSRWGATLEELDVMAETNPSLRGFLFGYLAEQRLLKLLSSDPRITNITKHTDHDRSQKGDILLTYKNQKISFEVKSLQTHTIKRSENGLEAKFQCDASDRREVQLPNGERIETTCLVIGEFDILAVNLFEFEGKWTFAFAVNDDLPRSNYKGYTSTQRKYLLATLMTISWPLSKPYASDPWPLMDHIIAERSR